MVPYSIIYINFNSYSLLVSFSYLEVTISFFILNWHLIYFINWYFKMRFFYDNQFSSGIISSFFRFPFLTSIIWILLQEFDYSLLIFQKLISRLKSLYFIFNTISIPYYFFFRFCPLLLSSDFRSLLFTDFKLKICNPGSTFIFLLMNHNSKSDYYISSHMIIFELCFVVYVQYEDLLDIYLFTFSSEILQSRDLYNSYVKGLLAGNC